MIELLLRRRLNNAKENIPYDAEVEYLQSDGYEYIDTGIDLVSDTTEVKIVFNSSFSATKYNNQSLMVCHSFPNGGVQVYISGSIYNQGAGRSISTNTYYTVTCITTATKRSIQLNSNTAATQNFNRSISDGSRLYIIGTAEEPFPTDGRCSRGNHKWYKVYLNGALVRDYIPVRVGTTGYLYDKVSGTLFGNAGTGSFTYGNDKT